MVSDQTGDDNAPDLNRLARDYLDLWQQQLAATTEDDTLARTMADAIRLMSTGVAQMALQASVVQDAMTGMGTTGAGTPDNHNHTARTSGATTTGSSHRPDESVFAELGRRIATLESRVTTLEGRLQGKG